MQTTTTSQRWTLNVSDVVKGLIIAVLSPVITIIMQSLNHGSLTFDWKAIGITALSAGLAYIVKNWLTPAQVVVSDPEAAKAVKNGELKINFTENKN